MKGDGDGDEDEERKGGYGMSRRFYFDDDEVDVSWMGARYFGAWRFGFFSLCVRSVSNRFCCI